MGADFSPFFAKFYVSLEGEKGPNNRALSIPLKRENNKKDIYKKFKLASYYRYAKKYIHNLLIHLFIH